jgi:hypothetical protein
MGPTGPEGPRGRDALHYELLHTHRDSARTLVVRRSEVLRIPGSLSVEFGNSGNHAATLKVTKLMTCVYRGGSAQSNPSPGSIEFERGRQYALEKCIKYDAASDADIDSRSAVYKEAEALDVSEGVKVEESQELQLRIHNAGSHVGRARVLARIEIQSND